MAAANYYLVSALPSLAELGSIPPLSLAALRDHVSERAGPRALVEAILLGDDLLQRDAVLAGESVETAPAVLAPAQVRNEEPLPPYLAGAGEAAASRIAADAVWDAYFRHAAGVARASGSRFLATWVGREVALRNALATARAKALDLEPADYLVAAELGQTDDDFAALVAEWAAAANPLEGIRVLDAARWQWLVDHDAWFSFGDDELAAYAAKLMLLARWHRLSTAPAAKPTG